MNHNALLALTCLALASASPAAATIIDPVDMRGLRNGSLLSFSAVKIPTEDRTVAHFDISGLVGDVSNATLNVGISNSDSGLPDGTLSIYAFAGDGTVSGDEWAVGALAHTFLGIEGGVQTLTVNIGALLATAIGNGDQYISFNFRTVDSDSYWMAHVIGGTAGSISSAGPTFIDTVPEPSTALLLALGLAGIAVRRRRTAAR